MSNQWYYNYPPPNAQCNPQYPQTAPPNPSCTQWDNSQYSQSAQYNYPVVPSYPPPPVPRAPSAVFSTPPPGVHPQNFGYNYPPQQFQFARPPCGVNDYAKDLENYKFIKSKIGGSEVEKSYEKLDTESMDLNGNGMLAKEYAPTEKNNYYESSEDLDFTYDDCDAHVNEIAELYSYTEHEDLHLNLSSFEEQMKQYNMTHMWRNLTEDQKCSVVLKILDQLELSDKTKRMKSARCILYIAQGSWLGIQSDLDQTKCAKKNCILLYKLGTFNSFVDLLNLEIESSKASINSSSISMVDSEDLRIILSVLYTITEVVRSEKDTFPEIHSSFCYELLNSDDMLIVKLFNMLTKFCSGSSSHFPVKKILLLLWKLILLTLGGVKKIDELKKAARRKHDLPDLKEDASKIINEMRPSSPPNLSDLLDDQNQRKKRSLIKQGSLEETEPLDMEMVEGGEQLFTRNNKSISLNLIKPTKLPWKPKVHKNEINAFLNLAREKFLGYSLEDDSTLFGLPKPIHESVQTLREHIYTSVAEVQVLKEDAINKHPLTVKDEIDLVPAEILYQSLYPNMPQYMICLLKILLATTSRARTGSDSINILGDVLPKEMPLTSFQSMKLGIDVNRHKEIIIKAISGILLLLLKHFKLNHVYQFEFMSQHLMLANCIPLILKFFNQEIMTYIKAGNDIPVLDFPSAVLGDGVEMIASTIEIGCDTKHCWRNVFSSINLLRVLNKLCKWKNSRIMMLVVFKSAPILKKTLKIRDSMAQLYVLKLIKMQAKYLGRNWRKANLKTVSLIYQKVRHHLNDDWAYGNNLDARPWDFQAEEMALRTAVEMFNNRREYNNSTSNRHWRASSSSSYRSTNDGNRNKRDSRSRSNSRERRYRRERSVSKRSHRTRSRSRSVSPHRNAGGFKRTCRSRSGSGSRSPYRAPSSSMSSKSLERSRNPPTERDQLLTKWRRNYCTTKQQLSTKLEELASMSIEDILENEKTIWTRSTPADLFYVRDVDNPKIMIATDRLVQLCDNFEEQLVTRARKVNALKPKYEPPPRKNRARLCKHKTEAQSSSDSSDENLTDEEDCTMEELHRKQQHPDRLHPEMWFNEPGEMNDGPLCRCSLKSKKSGIRHGIYPGEQHLETCNMTSNNADRLHHYRITISPPTNFLIKTPTIIHHDEHEFIFEGFSLFSHHPLEKLPNCKVIRFNIEYTILYIEEKIPENFTVRELDLFNEYLFEEILELVDLDFKASGDREGCAQFHFMPRFVRELPENGKEILCMSEVLHYLLKNSQPLINQSELKGMMGMSQYEWQSYADEIKGMIVTYPGKRPCSVRVDQLDRNIDLQKEGKYKFPEIVHFGIRPPQLSYAGNPEYQKAWRDYVKFRHLLANMSKPTYEDKRKLEAKENKLQEMRTQGKMKRDVTVAVSSEGFYRTGIMCDIIQHAMLIPVLVCHLRFHHSLNVLEESIEYTFANRALLQLALTHPSYKENFGTNPDHARNSLTNCGIRQPEYGDRRIHYMNTRKRGINTLINIMSRFGKQQETESNITHNERLEFLGDAVVEFLSSIHLFYSFPDLEEGGLATYRAAIVQNQHLSVLAKILKLDQYMLYAHGSDLCHDLELRHAMANCFEALMGALFLDGGIQVADKIFSATFFHSNPELHEVWVSLPPHPLQEQEPLGDRQWIEKFDILQNLVKFEESLNVEFKHIRLLARAFTDRSVGYTNLTMGSNQRLEFLGDTVLQLIASDYLYKYFPEHHEGHLSLLRSSLVNNRTQAVVCDDLDMSKYAIYNNPKAELKTKDRADLLEAFIGALYVDQGMEFCEVFCQVTLFPRLQDFIMNQDWNDPKSKLQQCCLTLRTMDGGEPDIPVYKVIECKGPTNTRVYTVAVYFRGRRLASAMGHSIQQAEMNAAKNALEISQDLFPQLDHQKRVIAKSMKKQKRKCPPGRGKASQSTSRSPERYSKNRFYRSRSRSPEDYERRPQSSHRTGT